MYNSHPSDGTYGSPGFYVDNPTGKVKDASGRLVDLRPDETERYARRVMVRTSELQKNSDGVYVAKIRKAKNVTAIKLSYASIPRPVSRVTAQLILYSIAIKKNLNSAEHQKLALQRMCRNQLLSPDTSDVPFFQMSTNDFDWRNPASTSAWINSFDRNTFIPPQLESEISNQYVDIDVLTVNVPSMCNLYSLGMAFSNILKSHSGAENTRNNSIWNSFDISVEETGFSVIENINDADAFTTFASVAPPYVSPDNNATSLIGQNQSGADSFIPMGTPLKIRMKKSRSVFVSSDTLTGASTSPAYISPSFSNMTEFAPTNATSSSNPNPTVFETEVHTPNRLVYSFSCIGDVSDQDILEVEYVPVIELHITSLPSSNVDDPTFGVRYYYAETLDITDGNTLVYLRTDENSTIELQAKRENLETIQIIGGFNADTGVLTVTKDDKQESSVVRVGSSLFHYDSNLASRSVSVSEVRRTYQKTRDVRLGLRWGKNTENEDFFIDTNHSLDSPKITNDSNIQNINPNYTVVGQQRRDVALLSQYSKQVKGTQTNSTQSSRTKDLTLQAFDAVIIQGMVLSTSKLPGENPVPYIGNTITVKSAKRNSDNPGSWFVTISEEIPLEKDMIITFVVAPVSDSTYHNMLRNTGDLEDTYMDPTSTSSEIYNVHQINDAHQIKKMLFTGHMMNVTEPSAMPVETTGNRDHPDKTTGKRPRVVEGSETTPSKAFYEAGLGWQASIVHAPTRFIMPAFPGRFTEINDYSNSGSPPSIYSTTSVPVETSVSPLVSRILNPTSVVPSAAASQDPQQLGYYQLNKVYENGTIDHNFVEKKEVHDLSCYTPRSDNTCGIVVTIGNENYVIKKARLISVLRNETVYTLNLTCDRNYNSSSIVLSSIKNLENIKAALRSQGYKTDKEQTDLQNRIQRVETEIQNAFHCFYESTTGDYEVDANSKYFSWVYELDRPVQLPTGISAATHNAYRPGDKSTYNPPITDRRFNGIVDNAALFTPGIYERNTGRCAVTNIQESAHSFSVRSGSQESENSLLLLHGIGSLERPLNSTHSTYTGDVFAVMGAEHDLKKPEKMACDATTFLRSPENLDSLNFSFMNSRNGEAVDIGNQNATLIFDIYCSNE